MKAIVENITITDHNKDLVAFAQTIDFLRLFDHIKALTGVTCTFGQPEIRTSRQHVYISFTSDNIAAQTGPFTAVLKNCYFYSFSSDVIHNQDTDELGYYVTVSIMYEHKDFGSNGMEVVRASYTERTGWEFRDAGQTN